MDQSDASAFAPSGALKRAPVRSALLVAAAGTFLALSAAPSSADDVEPTVTTSSQQGDTSSEPQTESQETSGEEPAAEEPSTDPSSEPASEPAQDEGPQPAPAEEPADDEPVTAEPESSEPAAQEPSTEPSTTSSDGSSPPPSAPAEKAGSTVSPERSGDSGTPVQTEDSGSSAAVDGITRKTARRTGTTDVVDGVASTLQRSSARTTDLLEDGRLPRLADLDSTTEPLRSVVEDRLAAGHLVPDLGGVLAGTDAPAAAPVPSTEGRQVRRPAPAGQLSSGDVVRRDAPSMAGAGDLRPTPRIDWTPAFDARSGETDAAAPREGPASPNPTPAWSDALTASSSAPGGFDLASAARLAGDVEARAGAVASDSRTQGVLLADPAGHPGFSPD